MSENEKEILSTIRESKDPEAALLTAIEVIKDYLTLTQLLSSTLQEVGDLAG